MSIDMQSSGQGDRNGSGIGTVAAGPSDRCPTGRKHAVFQWHNPLVIMALQELHEKLRAPKCAIMEAALVAFQSAQTTDLKHWFGASFKERADRLAMRVLTQQDWSQTNGDWQEFVEEHEPNKPRQRKDGLPDGRSPKDSKNRCCALNLRQTWDYILALKELAAELQLPEVEVVEQAFWRFQARIDGPLECRPNGDPVT